MKGDVEKHGVKWDSLKELRSDRRGGELNMEIQPTTYRIILIDSREAQAGIEFALNFKVH